MLRASLVLLLSVCLTQVAAAEDLPWIAVSADKTVFVELAADHPFTPLGFNYDHDRDGRLLEDYWEAEWPKVELHFAEMKKLGATVVRIHLQVAHFMQDAQTPNERSLERLSELLKLAERERLYLDLTGLGCYHKQDVPAWYDALSEQDRWAAQARFWKSIAGRCADSPAVFCYDLMNEPVVPGGKRNAGDWLGPPFGGKHFVQVISLDQNNRPRPEIAKQWIHQLVAAIREVDQRHLITVGLVDWSLDRPGLTSGFVPSQVAAELDFIAVHVYPKTGKLDEALETLAGFAIGKPIIIEEIFPLGCTTAELEEFIHRSKNNVCGWIGFYWGQPLDELLAGKTFAEAITRDWLLLFQKLVDEAKE